MSDREFHEALFDANDQLITAYHRYMIETEREVFRTMYFKQDDSSIVPPHHR